MMSDVIFWRPQAAPIGGRFDAAGIDRDGLTVDPANSAFGQQCLDDHFRLFVGALAENMVSDTPLRIDEIQRRPILIVEGAPDDMVVVDRDRVIDPQVFHGPANVVRVLLE